MKVGEILQKFNNIKGYMLFLPGLVAGIILLVFSFTGSDNGTKAGENQSPETVSLSEYIETEERRLSSIISSVGGVGNVRVMIRFDSGAEYVYQSGTYKSEPLMLEEYSPIVSGVAVVCDGGDLPRCQKAIIEIVSALYGIPSSRISVSGTK